MSKEKIEQEETLKELYLESGNVVKLRNGDMGLIVKNGSLFNMCDLKKQKFHISDDCMFDFDDDLKASVEKMDIMSVFVAADSLQDCLDESKMDLLWRRAEIDFDSMIDNLEWLKRRYHQGSHMRISLDMAIGKLRESK